MNAPEPGARIRLIRHTDEYSTLQPGELGTVTLVDGLGTVHVRWDNGSALGLVPDAGDEWEEIS